MTTGPAATSSQDQAGRRDFSSGSAASADWPKIGDYGLIGDCRTAALVGRDGGIDWWCLPNFSGPAFFARLLDRRRGGHFLVQPEGDWTSHHAYLDDTNVLQTWFTAKDGRELLRLTDAITIPPGYEVPELMPQRELLRSLEVKADTSVRIEFEPRPGYGASRVPIRSRGKLGWICEWRDHLLALHTDLPLQVSDDGTALRGSCRLRAGERYFFSVSYVQRDMGIIMPLGESARQRMEATARWWRNWSGHCAYQGPYRKAVLRSALATKLLTYCLSGAVVAAPTTSLPETFGGSRNWDYRYCWLRDASLTLEAFVDLGFESEADDFLGWLLHTTSLTRPQLQVVYDVYGESHLPERTLDHLEGYRQSRPVRVGNAAWSQRQLDIYGSVVMAAASYARRGGRISRDGCRMLVSLGKVVCRNWREPDQGIWEIRGQPRQHTYSKLTCWAALENLLDLSRRGVLQAPEAVFRRERDAIRQAIEANAFRPEMNGYSGTFEAPMADASLLLMPRFGYLQGQRDRMRGTIDYILHCLASGPLVYRYRSGADGLPGKESPFGICSFWAVDALARAGRVEEATRQFEAMLNYASELGLYGEEINADTGEAMGNFPQAFTHVGLINAALTLQQAKERGNNELDG